MKRFTEFDYWLIIAVCWSVPVLFCVIIGRWIASNL